MDEPYEECNNTECYVCYEPCDTLASCKCKTLYVHDSCIAIMRLYGKESCGVCKEPYPLIERPLELKEPDEDEHYIPCCFYILPTACRQEDDLSTWDKFLDLVRYMIVMLFFFWLIFGSTLYIPGNNLSVYISILFIASIFGCFVLEQYIKRRQRMIYLQTNREIENV